MEKLILNQYKHSAANPRGCEPAWAQIAGGDIYCSTAAASRLRAAVCPGSASPTAPVRAVRERQEHGEERFLLLEL